MLTWVALDNKDSRIIEPNFDAFEGIILLLNLTMINAWEEK